MASATVVAFQGLAGVLVRAPSSHQYSNFSTGNHDERGQTNTDWQFSALVVMPMLIGIPALYLAAIALAVWRGPWWWTAMNLALMLLFAASARFAAWRAFEFLND